MRYLNNSNLSMQFSYHPKTEGHSQVNYLPVMSDSNNHKPHRITSDKDILFTALTKHAAKWWPLRQTTKSHTMPHLVWWVGIKQLHTWCSLSLLRYQDEWGLFPSRCNVFFLPFWGLHTSLRVHFPTCDQTLLVNDSSAVPENKHDPPITRFSLEIFPSGKNEVTIFK